MKNNLFFAFLTLSLLLATSVKAVNAAPKTSWTSAIKSGASFTVNFDVNPTSDPNFDAAWTGDWRTDDMGTLRWGKTYTVTYDNRQGWNTIGYNENDFADYGVTTSNYYYPANMANPSKHELDMWGRNYTFDDAGNVYDKDFGLVGHLE